MAFSSSAPSSGEPPEPASPELPVHVSSRCSGSDPVCAPASGRLPELEEIGSLLQRYSPLALAFSGGLDSRFLAHLSDCFAARGVRMHLFHIQGPHVQRAETREALAWAESRGLPLTLARVNPLDLPLVRANGVDRCYHCKRHLFSVLQKAVEEHPDCIGKKFTLCDGTNASDLGQHRPGLRALAELGVRSPLAEAGLGKEAIRRLGAATGLDRFMQRARPCLLTRFAYGLFPSAEALAALDLAEEAVAVLLAEWAGVPATEQDSARMPDFRLRLGTPATDGPPFSAELHLSENVPEELRRALLSALSAEGFLLPVLVIPETLSGYYDQLSGLRLR